MVKLVWVLTQVQDCTRVLTCGHCFIFCPLRHIRLTKAAWWLSSLFGNQQESRCPQQSSSKCSCLCVSIFSWILTWKFFNIFLSLWCQQFLFVCLTLFFSRCHLNECWSELSGFPSVEVSLSFSFSCRSYSLYPLLWIIHNMDNINCVFLYLFHTGNFCFPSETKLSASRGHLMYFSIYTSLSLYPKC